MDWGRGSVPARQGCKAVKNFALGLFFACFILIWAPPSLVGLWLGIAMVLLLFVQWLIPTSGPLFLGFLLGVALAGLDLHSHSQHSRSFSDDRSTVVMGRIHGMVEGDSGSYRFRFFPDGSGKWLRQPSIQVRWHEAAFPPQAGERWQLTLLMDPQDDTALPGTFDRARWAFRERLLGTARVDRQATATRMEASGAFLGDRLGRWRRQLSDAIDQALDTAPEAALLQGVTVGDRSRFSQTQWGVLNATGTTHLVAISGLHVGLVGGLVLLLFQGITRFWSGIWPSRLMGACAGLLAAGLYAGLAGFALPTQRALLMFSVLVLLLLLRRNTSPGTGLALAGVAVLVLDPRAVMDAGFYLSFSLVALVLVVMAAGDRPGRLAAFVRIQWVTGLAILPVLIVLFGLGPVSSPVANALAVPVFSVLVVPLALLGVLGSAVGLETAASGLWTLAAACLGLLWPALEQLAEWPQLSATPSLPVLWSVFGLLAMAALMLPGPLVPRACLLLALLPGLLGLGQDHRRLGQMQHYPLQGEGQIWTFQQGETPLIWLDVGPQDVNRDLMHWLSAQPSDTPLLLINRQGLGPVRLDRLLSDRQGPVLMREPQRASPGPARHCPGNEWAGWAVAGHDSERPCLLQGGLAEWRINLDPGHLTVGAGDEAWVLPREQWAGQAISLGHNGKLQEVPRRRHWWRP